MSVKRKTYSPAEKARIALEAIKGNLTAAEITAQFDVHTTQVNQWKRQALDSLPELFTNKTKALQVDYESQLAELYQQIGRLKVENDFLKKNLINLKGDRRLWLEPNSPGLSIRQQCVLLEINRSSVYYTSHVAVSDETLALLRIVDEVYTQYPFFGTRQMASYLRTQGHDVEREQIRGIYERLGLRSLAPGPHTSKPHPEHKIYPYLLRGATIVRPDHVWSTDITYIRLQRGFVYLMAIIDWYSRYVLDWELSISLEADFCIDTLGRVLTKGKCSIFNTDQVCNLQVINLLNY